MARAGLRMRPMWRGLPKEILEFRVLPYLPMASLCRFRAVCRTWNALIIHGDFAARHALASPPEEFVILRLGRPENALGGLSILDVANNRIIPLSDDLLATDARPSSSQGQMRNILAADGGLLFIWCGFVGNCQDHLLIVYNPILKAVKVIPSLQGWVRANYSTSVVMSTDKVSMEYEILVFHPRNDHYQAKCMDVFESKTGRWRRVVNPSVPSPGRWYLRSRFAKFENALYRLFRSMDDMKPCLIKYDNTTGVGSIVHFHVPFLSGGDREVDCMGMLELVVSQDRLFSVSKCWILGGQSSYLEIFEIFPERHEFKRLAMMPGGLLRCHHDNHLFRTWTVQGFRDHPLLAVLATRYVSSIIICSSLSRFLAYNLADKSWHLQLDLNRALVFPQPDLDLNSPPVFRHSLYLRCCNFSLSLCPP